MKPPKHRASEAALGRALGFDFGDLMTVLSVERCRCGAWRASVVLADAATFESGRACPLYTDWSAPAPPKPKPADEPC